ncbi:MAG: hypothetical protein ACYDBB_26940 [Armatimonadota bacterium]
MNTNESCASISESANRIHTCMMQFGGDYAEWYVGVAAESDTSVFARHNVGMHEQAVVLCQCINEREAHEVMCIFRCLGCDGHPLEVSLQPQVYVYAFRKDHYTAPSIRPEINPQFLSTKAKADRILPHLAS